ncbi:DUF805 domain-containing protein [Bosea robiniae]|uniref:Uncharacterized membrane protein YhaH, DUF805 family n=1 Tax=Bosea robiniae TaxID=1036780 RepID=A0ABY0NRC7_9HYPH|nr:hypothetical protein [Bosea robiniae]SDF65326.1 Uncharacterized membrane protein YhaH, DUF805 family [Bosea robiniae]
MSLIRLFSDFDGRIGLRTFWLGSIAVALTLLAIQRTVPLLVGYRDAIMVVAFVKAFALFPWAALAAKRATDRGSTPLFGILLVCAIVLPEHLRVVMPFGWRPSLEAISTMAWVVAFIDLGLLPSATKQDRVAATPAGARTSD